MAVIRFGPGVRVLVYFCALFCIVGASFYGGMRMERARSLKSSVQVLKNDSVAGRKIHAETEAIKKEVRSDVQKINAIVDRDCYVSPKFMQLMESAKSAAERRGDQAYLIRAFTEP